MPLTAAQNLRKAKLNPDHEKTGLAAGETELQEAFGIPAVQDLGAPKPRFSSNSDAVVYVRKRCRIMRIRIHRQHRPLFCGVSAETPIELEAMRVRVYLEGGVVGGSRVDDLTHVQRVAVARQKKPARGVTQYR